MYNKNSYFQNSDKPATPDKASACLSLQVSASANDAAAYNFACFCRKHLYNDQSESPAPAGTAQVYALYADGPTPCFQHKYAKKRG